MTTHTDHTDTDTDPEGFDAFFDAYVTCLLWSSVDTDPADPEGDYVNLDEYPEGPTLRADLRPDALAWFRDWAAFWRANGWDDGQAGHDFALTRNGHGAGYWDRGPGQEIERAGRELTNACRPYGSVEPYLGDDGAIYV